jgi:(+)-abscisic acid 8'-hydroxylase
MKRTYYILEKGYNSMPINLSGTLFNKSMKYLSMSVCLSLLLVEKQRTER